jgi:type I restriction enzyme S subunit
MILNEKYYLNSQAFTIKSNSEKLINEYLWYYLDNIKQQIFNCGRGSAQKAIDIDEFKNIKIPIPSLEKQKEIVEYLDFNNNLIDNLNKEIENNKKQGELFFNMFLSD